MSVNVRLGLYDEIDSGFQHWKSYDDILKKYLIESDVEIFTRANYGQDRVRAANVTADMLLIIKHEFARMSETGSEEMKIIYSEFIAGIAKPTQKAIKKPQGERDDEGDLTYTKRDEYNVSLAMQQDYDKANDEYEIYADRVEILKILTIDANLSSVEKAALDFTKYKEINPLLEIFTMRGIIQIANRAAYKLFNA